MPQKASGLMYGARQMSAATIIIFPIIWLTDPFGMVRAWLLMDQMVTLELGLAMALIFWSEKERARPGGLDLAAGAVALLTSLWLAVRYEEFGLGLSLPGVELITLSVVLLLLVLECTRRSVGRPMTILVLAIAIYGYAAQFLTGMISAPPTQLGDYVAYLAVTGDSLLGQALKIIVSVVVVFILFGAMLDAAGGGNFVKNLSLRLAGSTRGGPIKIAVLSSGMLGSIVGSTTSNIMTTGSFTIPMMRKIGVPAHRAAAVEAVASTGGQLTPPVMGAAAFLMADIAGLPYTSVILAALLPSLLYYFSLYVQADRIAARYNLTPGAEYGETSPAGLLREAAIYSLPVIAIVAALALYEHAPYRAGLLGAAAAAAIALARSRSLVKLWHALVAAGEMALPIVITGATVGIMIGVVNATGIGVTMTIAVSSMAEHSLLIALLLTAAAAYLLGMGLATTAVYVLVGILLAPTLIELGISTMAAHLFVFYTAMLSMITPPVAIACLVAAGIADATFLKTSIYAVKFGWIKFIIPFLFVYSPELLLEGNLWHIGLVIIATSTGIVLMANASSGFDRKRLSLPARLANATAAMVLMLPLVPLEYRAAIALAAILWMQRHNLLFRRMPFLAR